jgi:lipopolysaccharide biosynthesis glycosyltransferase
VSEADPIRVFVGVDRSQVLAVDVLEHSIRRHTSARVEVHPMLDVPARDAKDPRQGKRTGFSFARFLIPALCQRRGKAIYLDADMLVFSDLRRVWDLPFEGAKIVIQHDLTPEQADTAAKREGAPAQRRRQWAVMLLDCSRLDWDVDAIIDGLDVGTYTYDQLMSDFCILGPDDVRQAIPFEWNSLEHWDESTCLLHYTDVRTQPWTSTMNPWDHKWFDEVRLMIETGALTWAAIEREIAAGYFRPSLLRDLRFSHRVPRRARPLWRRVNAELDRRAGYVPHREVYEQKRRRKKAIQELEAALAAKGSP